MKESIRSLFYSDFEYQNQFKVGVYSIYCVANNKTYIGSTSSKSGFYNRWRWHIYALRYNRHTNTILQRVYNKYGEKSLKLKIIELCDNDTEFILSREQFYINTLKPELNINQIAFGCKFPEGWVSPNAKPVLQYDLEGNYIKEYKSISEAKRAVKGDVLQAIKNLSRYKTTQAGGYQWRFKESNDFPIKIEKYQYTQAIPILCYNSDGDFYKEYPSILKAATELNLEVGNICRTVKGLMQSYNGYFFEEKKSDTYPLHINKLLKLHKKQLSVGIEDLETGKEYHFNSLRQIPKELLSRASLRPYLKKGLKEFIFKRRVSNKTFKIKIQGYNKA